MQSTPEVERTRVQAFEFVASVFALYVVALQPYGPDPDFDPVASRYWEAGGAD